MDHFIVQNVRVLIYTFLDLTAVPHNPSRTSAGSPAYMNVPSGFAGTGPPKIFSIEVLFGLSSGGESEMVRLENMPLISRRSSET